MESDEQLLSQALDCLIAVIERENVSSKTEYILRLAMELIAVTVPALETADVAAAEIPGGAANLSGSLLYGQDDGLVPA